ncbi:MAG: hypothetical protein EOP48_33000 [Sphingobacteriales bacterium]|nr:MAG: hypothetical protein EOP48_33000 [Sphingobacteriales bacterium]
MEKPLVFEFEGKKRLATVYISLQDDGCFLFTAVHDEEIIDRFGDDIDFELDKVGDFVKQTAYRIQGYWFFRLLFWKPQKRCPSFNARSAS